MEPIFNETKPSTFFEGYGTYVPRYEITRNQKIKKLVQTEFLEYPTYLRIRFWFEVGWQARKKFTKFSNL
jgi:hypothetical protein